MLVDDQAKLSIPDDNNSISASMYTAYDPSVARLET